MPKLKRLSEKYWIAIDMKWKNFGYREIAEKLGVSLDTVKSWFRKNGLLGAHYKDYVEDQIIEAKRKIHLPSAPSGTRRHQNEK